MKLEQGYLRINQEHWNELRVDICWYRIIVLFFINIDLCHSLCCQCGVLTTPNPSNMCVGCLRSQVDITEGIPKQSNLCFCKACERWEVVFNPARRVVLIGLWARLASSAPKRSKNRKLIEPFYMTSGWLWSSLK